MAGTRFPSEVEVAVIGGGAAGIGAGMRLKRAGVSFLIIEARKRLGGRAWTVDTGQGFPVDLGCGWLHSADLNPWSEIAEASGFAIDRTPAPWSTRAPPLGFSREEWLHYRASADAFYGRVVAAAKTGERPAADLLEPGAPWNGLIGAVSTYANGVELDVAQARVELRERRGLARVSGARCLEGRGVGGRGDRGERRLDRRLDRRLGDEGGVRHETRV